MSGDMNNLAAQHIASQPNFLAADSASTVTFASLKQSEMFSTSFLGIRQLDQLLIVEVNVTNQKYSFTRNTEFGWTTCRFVKWSTHCWHNFFI